MPALGGAESARRFAVLGLGNRIQGDEALGAITVECLRRELPPSLDGSVALIDGGTVGLGLLPYLEDLDGLIVVDAVDRGVAPGSLVEIEVDPLRPAPSPLGVHELGAAELLGALLITGRLPARVRVIGLQPERIALGTELSPALASQLPHLVTRITERLTGWSEETGLTNSAGGSAT
jgi:hydrogenase maturation protease